MIANAKKAISGGSKFFTYFFHSEFTSGGGEERAHFAVVQNSHYQAKGRHKKNRLFLGKSPKLLVGGGQES